MVLTATVHPVERAQLEAHGRWRRATPIEIHGWMRLATEVLGSAPMLNPNAQWHKHAATEGRVLLSQ
jgi:hypothetical protein